MVLATNAAAAAVAAVFVVALVRGVGEEYSRCWCGAVVAPDLPASIFYFFAAGCCCYCCHWLCAPLSPPPLASAVWLA